MNFFQRRGFRYVLLVGVLAVLAFYLLGGTGGDEPEISVFFVETGEERTMPIEEYLQGVVAGEMAEDWPTGAYAAQAILARSFTMKFIEEGGSEYGTDISTDHEEAQAYDEEKVTEEIKEAVERTRGEVMLYEGDYVDSWFHAAAGGQTATAIEGLNIEGEDPPYITSVQSPDMGEEVDEDVRSWTATFTESELQEALVEMEVEGIGEIEELEVTDTGPSGRATALQISHTEGEEEVHPAELRLALDATELRSTFFTEPIAAEGGEFTFTGKGYGHGVGLSQWGAFVMTEEGQSPEDIVNHYFEGIEIETKW